MDGWVDGWMDGWIEWLNSKDSLIDDGHMDMGKSDYNEKKLFDDDIDMDGDIITVHTVYIHIYINK